MLLRNLNPGSSRGNGAWKERVGKKQHNTKHQHHPSSFKGQVTNHATSPSPCLCERAANTRTRAVLAGGVLSALAGSILGQGDSSDGSCGDLLHTSCSSMKKLVFWPLVRLGGRGRALSVFLS